MQHPDEGTIHAWLDGELSSDEAAELEAHVAECQVCAAAVAEARGYVAASSRIVSALDAVPGNVIPEARPRRRWYSSTQLRAAAAVIIVAGASLLVVRQTDKASLDDMIVASRPAAPASEAAPQLKSPVAQTSTTVAAPIPKQSGAGKTTPSARKAGKRVTPSPLAVTTASPAVSRAPVTIAQKAADEARSETAANVERARQQFGRVAAVDSTNARRFTATMTDVVATGVARAEELTVMQVDTLPTGIRTTYRVPDGKMVTLMESPMKAIGSSVMNAPPPVPPAEAKAAVQQLSVVSSITWIESATGRTATLSGPFTREELSVLRQKLPVERR
jgi:hypothetical protein